MDWQQKMKHLFESFARAFFSLPGLSLSLKGERDNYPHKVCDVCNRCNVVCNARATADWDWISKRRLFECNGVQRKMQRRHATDATLRATEAHKKEAKMEYKQLIATLKRHKVQHDREKGG